MSPVPPKPPRAPTDVPRERSGPTHHNRFARPATAVGTPSPRPGSIATVSDEDFDSNTPVNASDTELIAFRLARTTTSSKIAAENSAELKSSLRATNERIDNVVGELSELRETVGEMKGSVEAFTKSNERLVGIMEKQLDASNQRQNTIVQTETETKRQIALVPVEQARSWIDTRKTIVGAVFSSAAITALIAWFTSGKGC